MNVAPIAATMVMASILPLAKGEKIGLRNPSFEEVAGNDPVHVDEMGRLRLGHSVTFFPVAGELGFADANAILGWVGEAENGTMAVITGGGAGAKFSAIPDGRNTFFSRGPGIVQQTVTNTISAGTRYTFRIMAGRPLNMVSPALWDGGAIFMLAEENFLSVTNLASDLKPGEFRAIEATYSVAEADPMIGKRITVAVSSGWAGETHFDSASLEAMPLKAPEVTVASAVRISWPTLENEWYRLERTASLTSPLWKAVAPPFRGTANPMTFFEVPPGDAEYYRVVTIPPP
jgi:hypothetical protein